MKKILLVFLLCQPFFAAAQQKYIILFKDKGTAFSTSKPEDFLSPRALQRRQKQNILITNHDLPVNQEYVKSLGAMGARVVYTSKWLNGALIDLSSDKLQEILKQSYVKGLEGNTFTSLKIDNAAQGTKALGLDSLPDAGFAVNQLRMLGADSMHARGFTGKNVLVGVFDSGFPKVDTLDVFKKLFSENRVKDTYNFVKKKTDVYRSSNSSHGTSVLSCIAANWEGKMIGTAPGADFILYITEDASSETKLEEMNWLVAAERADSIGIDIISSSLGYNDFEGSDHDYSYSDMDGNTALVTRAADWAASKGIVVVNSAGNEARKPWRYITAPADGDSVIAVAAVDAKGQYASFSSIGPRPDGHLKPDLAAMGARTAVALTNNSIASGDGTSFSAPLMTGLVAGLKQAFPDLTAMQLREALLTSGSQANNPDNLLGYGIPNFNRAYEAATLKSQLLRTEEEFPDEKPLLVYPNPVHGRQVLKVVVRKKNTDNEFGVRLTNATGQPLYENRFKKSRFEIPLPAGVAGGVFFLTVWNTKFSATVKVIEP